MKIILYLLIKNTCCWIIVEILRNGQVQSESEYVSQHRQHNNILFYVVPSNSFFQSYLDNLHVLGVLIRSHNMLPKNFVSMHSGQIFECATIETKGAAGIPN